MTKVWGLLYSQLTTWKSKLQKHCYQWKLKTLQKVTYAKWHCSKNKMVLQQGAG